MIGDYIIVMSFGGTGVTLNITYKSIEIFG
jgi:hypothetical protein